MKWVVGIINSYVWYDVEIKQKIDRLLWKIEEIEVRANIFQPPLNILVNKDQNEIQI